VLSGAWSAFGAERPGRADALEPHIAFPTAPRDRIAVSSYPFRAYINSPSGRNRGASAPNVQKIDLTEFPAEVAKKFNVSHIEPNSRHFMSTDAAYLDRFNDALAKAGVKVANIAVDGRGSFYDPDPAIRTGAITNAKNWVDVAVHVGSPSIRAHIAGSRNSDPNVDRAAESLKEVADYGAQKNVVINLENDDPKSEDAFFIVKVIEAVNHPYLHALPDFANSMLNGDADFNYRALTAMFQHAYCICHVKDGEDSDNGPVTIDIKKSFDILKASGYRGFCSMEFDAKSGDPYAATQSLIEQTLKYLA
ncbi:MAG: sugar phosphate isomerase/epimerase family protein, partial [Candidatus Acidiferrales bacterium]